MERNSIESRPCGTLHSLTLTDTYLIHRCPESVTRRLFQLRKVHLQCKILYIPGKGVAFAVYKWEHPCFLRYLFTFCIVTHHKVKNVPRPGAHDHGTNLLSNASACFVGWKSMYWKSNWWKSHRCSRDVQLTAATKTGAGYEPYHHTGRLFKDMRAGAGGSKIVEVIQCACLRPKIRAAVSNPQTRFHHTSQTT